MIIQLIHVTVGLGLQVNSMNEIYVVYHQYVDYLIGGEKTVHSVHKTAFDGIESIKRAYQKMATIEEQYVNLLRNGKPNDDIELLEIEEELNLLLQRTKSYNRYTLFKLVLGDNGRVLREVKLDKETGKEVF